MHRLTNFRLGKIFQFKFINVSKKYIVSQTTIADGK